MIGGTQWRAAYHLFFNIIKKQRFYFVFFTLIRTFAPR